MIKRAQDEAGYSLVEVMATIVILAVAIIPMVGMFDTGLRTATLGGKHDKARAVANGAMESVKALPYNRTSTPAADSAVERFAPGADRSCPVTVPGGYTCAVRTAYANDSTLSGFSDGGTVRHFMRVTVTVRWDGGSKNVSTVGLVSGSRT